MTKNQSPLVAEIVSELKTQGNPTRAAFVAKYFKTAEGQYGFGDKFLGLSVPTSRKIANRYWRGAEESDLTELLTSEWHEVRFVALAMLVKQFATADEIDQKSIFDFYLTHLEGINNWDLVDASASYICGEYLLTHPEEKTTILQLLSSENLWHRRVAVLSMFPLVKAGRLELPLHVAKVLLSDKQDLLHKAVGWMLRNLGDTDSKALRSFLDLHLSSMPRTMLRYAIEHFDITTRKEYLQRK